MRIVSVLTGPAGGRPHPPSFLKSMLAVGFKLPVRRVLLSTGPVTVKAAFLEGARDMASAGVQFYGTRGTLTRRSLETLETKS